MTFWNSCAASSVVRLPLLYRECVQNNQCRERRLSCLSWKWRKRSSVNILSVGRWCLRCSGWFSPAFSTRRVDFLSIRWGIRVCRDICGLSNRSSSLRDSLLASFLSGVTMALSPTWRYQAITLTNGEQPLSISG